jgi:hypothetical protein
VKRRNDYFDKLMSIADEYDLDIEELIELLCIKMEEVITDSDFDDIEAAMISHLAAKEDADD